MFPPAATTSKQLYSHALIKFM